MPMPDPTEEYIPSLTGHLFRAYYGKMVAYLSQKYGYTAIENIMDSVQEAFEAALNTWKVSGVPKNHFAWLYRVATNKLLNRFHQAHTRQYHMSRLPVNDSWEPGREQEAEQSVLHLLAFFARIHMPERNKLMIALHYLCGFGYAEIAHAFFLKTETVKKAILRSKETIQEYSKQYDDFRYTSTGKHRDYLLRIIYLLYNEGYKTSGKKGSIQYDLCYEAIRLGKLLYKEDKSEVKVNALLALMFLNTARFPARTTSNNWILLEEQDRKCWDKALIREGLYYLKRAKSGPPILNSYYLEALISALHCSAPSFGETDWNSIAFLYRQLEILEPSSFMVTLSRLIAESHNGNTASLMLYIDTLRDKVTPEYTFIFFVAKAHLHSKQQEWHLALENYNKALDHVHNDTDTNFIRDKIQEITTMQGIKGTSDTA